ncbi:MAG: amidohydrolase family protein, partial [Spirochaetia bacterium]
MTRWDLLAVGGRIHSLEREGEVFSAIAVSGGKVAALFTEDPSPATAARARHVVDLDGRGVLPGLIDGHMHFLPSAVFREAALAVADIRPDGLAAQSLASIRDKMRAYAAPLPSGRPVFCHTYLIDAVKEKRLPRREELDAWVPGRAVIVLSMDGHSSAYSTRALEALGLLASCPDGVLSGSGHELSMGKVNSLLAGSVTLGMLARGIQDVVNDALSQGLVCLHCMDGFEDSKRDPALWLLSRCGGTLPIDLRLFIQYRDPARLAPYRRFLRDARIGGCFGWAMDGSISSGIAALDEPYVSDPENRGRLYFSAAEAAALVQRAARAGFQVTAHAIGT